MTRRIITLATLIVLVLGAVPARAHEAFRFVGTITKRAGRQQLGVKTKEGRTVYVELKKTTIVLRDKTKVPATELKPGLSVVVDALGDDDSDLTAKQVRIVPAITPAAGEAIGDHGETARRRRVHRERDVEWQRGRVCHSATARDPGGDDDQVADAAVMPPTARTVMVRRQIDDQRLCAPARRFP